MEIYDYHSAGGKNVILNYVEKLTKQEQLEIYDTREEIRKSGLDAFEKLNTRQLRGKLWEIKLSQNRIMYVIMNKDLLRFCIFAKNRRAKLKSRTWKKHYPEPKRKDYCKGVEIC